MKLLTKSSAPDAKLGVLERVSYMFGHTGIGIGTAASALLLFYYTEVVGLSGTIVATIMLITRVLDGVSDLLMGSIVDNTKSKYGKARAWLLRMFLPFALSIFLVFAVPQSFSDFGKYVFVFVTYNLLTTVFLTALNVPYSALMCNMTQDNYEHSLLGIFSMFGVVLGHLIINSTVDKITSAAATPAQGWRNAGLVYAIISIVLVLICFFGTKERWAETTSKESAEEKKLSLVDKVKLLLKNKYWVKMFVFAFLGLLTNAVISNSGLYFCKAVWGDTANYSVLSNALTLCQMISMLLVFILIKKLGKVKVALIGTIGTVAACVLQALVPHSLGVGIVCMAAKGLFFAFPSGCMFGLVADTIDYGEWQSGVKLPGVGMSVMAFGEKVAKGLGSVLIGFIVGSTSTAAAEVEQATVSVAQANLCFNILPAVLLGITIFVLFSYDYDKIAPQINEELKARRQNAE